MLAGRHGQIRRQLQEVRGGLRAVGRGDPLVKLGKLQPALAEGNSQMRDSLLALPVTDPQLRTALGFGGPSRLLGRSHLSTLTSRAAVPYVPSHSCFGTNCAAHLGPLSVSPQADLLVHIGHVAGTAAIAGSDADRMNDLLAARTMIAGGLFTVADAMACGYDRQSLSRLVKTGAAVRIARGAYAGRTFYAAASLEQRHRLATRATLTRLAGRAAASHYSALSLLELPLWRATLSQVHVARIGAGRGRRNSKLHIHSPYTADAYRLADGVPSVSPGLAVLGTAMLGGVEVGVVAADAALAAGLVTDADLRECLQQFFRHPSIRDARLVVDLADGRSESPGEFRARLVLRSLALGAVVPQVEIRDDNGRLVARVDFLYEQQRTIVEFDGLVKYGGADGHRALVAEKRREDRLLARTTGADQSG